MSDLDQTKKMNFSQKQNSGSTQNLKDKEVADAGAEINQRAGDAMRASADISRDKFKDVADAARDVAAATSWSSTLRIPYRPSVAISSRM